MYASMQRCNPSSTLPVALLLSSGHPYTACHRKRCGLLQSALAASHVAWRLLRDRGVTMLVRVDVSGGAGGVLLVSLSHQAAGFAPYRLDNCSCETLHLRYAQVPEQLWVLALCSGHASDKAGLLGSWATVGKHLLFQK